MDGMVICFFVIPFAFHFLFYYNSICIYYGILLKEWHLFPSPHLRSVHSVDARDRGKGSGQSFHSLLSLHSFPIPFLCYPSLLPPFITGETVGRRGIRKGMGWVHHVSPL